jgi:hypothetical protein
LTVLKNADSSDIFTYRDHKLVAVVAVVVSVAVVVVVG